MGLFDNKASIDPADLTVFDLEEGFLFEYDGKSWEVFREYFYDTKIFFDRFAKGKFGKYLLNRNETPPTDFNNDLVHRKIEESQLFLEAAHACYARLRDAETKENRG